MPFDAFVLAAVADEMQGLIGDRLEQVWSAEPGRLFLRLAAGRARRDLVFSLAAGRALTYVSDSVDRVGRDGGAFVGALRRHLLGARLRGVIQMEGERLLRLDWDRRDELGRPTSPALVAELIGRNADLVLVDERGRVVGVFGRSTGRTRRLGVGQPYALPPGVAPRRLPRPEAFRAWIDSLKPEAGAEFAAAMAERFPALTPALARVLEAECASRSTSDSPTLDALRPVRLSAAYARWYDRWQARRFEPCVVLGERDVTLDVWPWPMPGSASAASMSEAVARLDRDQRLWQARASRLGQLRSEIHGALKRTRRRLEAQLRDLARAGDPERWRAAGEYLLNHLADVPPGVSEWQTGAFPWPIELVPSLSPSENAQRCFQRYRKAQSAQIEAGQRAEESAREIVGLERLLERLAAAQLEDEVEALAAEWRAVKATRGAVDEASRLARSGSGARAETKERRPEPHAHAHGNESQPIAYRTPDGSLVLVGRNNRQNDWLTFQAARPGDVWLHAQKIPGAHVLLRPASGQASEAALLVAAQIAAFHSKGRNATRVPVDYTDVRNVRRQPGKRAGMVFYDRQRTLSVRPEIPAEPSPPG